MTDLINAFSLILDAYTPIRTSRKFAAKVSLNRTMYLYFMVLEPGIKDAETN